MIRLTLKRPSNKFYLLLFLLNLILVDEPTSSANVPTPQVLPKLRLNLANLSSSNNNSINVNVNYGSRIALPPSGIEDQFILRLPPSLASILTSELVENDYTSPGDLSIKFVTGRTAVVRHARFIKEAYPAVLMDSPTVMETLKSSNLIINEIGLKEDGESSTEAQVTDVNGEVDFDFNNKKDSAELIAGQYYKVADLNQILMVLDLDTVEGQRIFNRIPQSLQEQVLKCLQGHSLNHTNAALDDVTATWAQWPDGLTLPMKSAKSKRFASRPWHASTVGDLERIEREVERLLKSDGQAIESKFSLISEDGKVLLGDSDIIDDGKGAAVDLDLDLDEIDDEMEDSESSASDIEDMNDFAAEIEDVMMEGEELEGEDAELTEAEESKIPSTHSNIPVAIPSDQLEPPSSSVSSASDQLVKDLEARLAEKLKQAESVSNPLIKARIEDVIRQLEDNLKNLRERE